MFNYSTVISLALLHDGNISVKYSNRLFEDINSHLIYDYTNNLVYQIDNSLWLILGITLFVAAYYVLPALGNISKSLDTSNFKEYVVSSFDPMKESLISASNNLKERLPSIMDCMNSKSYNIYDYLPSDVVNYKTTFYQEFIQFNNPMDLLSLLDIKFLPVGLGGQLVVYLLNNSLPSTVFNNGMLNQNTPENVSRFFNLHRQEYSANIQRIIRGISINYSFNLIYDIINFYNVRIHNNLHYLRVNLNLLYHHHDIPSNRDSYLEVVVRLNSQILADLLSLDRISNYYEGNTIRYSQLIGTRLDLIERYYRVLNDSPIRDIYPNIFYYESSYIEIFRTLEDFLNR